MDKMIFNSRLHWFLGGHCKNIHTKQRRALKIKESTEDTGIRTYPKSPADLNVIHADAK